MAMNQFVHFMKNDLEGNSSSMCSFLSKRAKLMIAFSIELLGEYLKVLKRPGVEENVDVNAFLDDIAQNLEDFKDREKQIRERHFNYYEESQIIDSTLMKSEIFAPSEISQIHAVLKLFAGDKSLDVNLVERGKKIEITKQTKVPKETQNSDSKNSKNRETTYSRDFSDKWKEEKPTYLAKAPYRDSATKGKLQEKREQKTKSKLEDSDYIKNNVFDINDIQDDYEYPHERKEQIVEKPSGGSKKKEQKNLDYDDENDEYLEVQDESERKPYDSEAELPGDTVSQPITFQKESDSFSETTWKLQNQPKQLPEKKPTKMKGFRAEPESEVAVYSGSKQQAHRSENGEADDLDPEKDYYAHDAREEKSGKKHWSDPRRQSSENVEERYPPAFGSMVEKEEELKYPDEEDEQYFRIAPKATERDTIITKQRRSGEKETEKTPGKKGLESQDKNTSSKKTPVTNQFSLEPRKSQLENSELEREQEGPEIESEIPMTSDRRRRYDQSGVSHSGRRQREESPREASMTKSTKSGTSSKPIVMMGSYKDGFHRIKFENGVYEGEIMDNKRNGKGKYIWADGNVYEGDWLDDKKSGSGRFEWANGDSYEGGYYNDKRDGTGVKYYANGDVFEVGRA